MPHLCLGMSLCLGIEQWFGGLIAGRAPDVRIEPGSDCARFNLSLTFCISPRRYWPNSVMNHVVDVLVSTVKA